MEHIRNSLTKYIFIFLILSSCHHSDYLRIKRDSLKDAWPIDKCEMLPYKRFIAEVIADQYINRSLKCKSDDIFDIIGKPDTIIIEGINLISYGYVVGPSDCGREYKDGNVVFKITFDSKTKKINKILYALID